MEQHSLLQTKLHIPPVRPGVITRPRLIERLNAGLPTPGGISQTRDASPRLRETFPRALTLISAPAGFGKTTLVSEWVRQSQLDGTNGFRVAWLSLDEGDNDVARFLAYLIAALRPIGANVAKGVLNALQSPQPPPAEEILTPVINEIAAIPHRIVLVLDDYHLIDAQPIDDAVAFFLQHLPPQMHLVIATREDPHLPVARLRVQGQLTELRAADLRFTSAEAAQFLNQVMGLDLSAEDIATLETKTEGWIAGLQLAALALQGLDLQGIALQGTNPMQGRRDTSSLIRSFTGSHRYVLDYLIEEVLDQQSERIQTFLLQTSILGRLSGPLCDAVAFGPAASLANQDSGQATLEMLERANLFIIPLDEERRWYRYHHLFSDLLRQRLSQWQPDWGSQLHHRASEWYEQNGFADEAIEHALRAEDFERAAHLIEEHVDAIWQSGEHTKLWRWIEGVPAEFLFSNPHLCVFHARNLIARGQQDAAEQSLQAAEQALGICTSPMSGVWPTEQDQVPGPRRKQLQGRIAVNRALLAFFRGDVPGIIQHSRQALEYLPEQDSAWRSSAAIALGDAHRIQGDVKATYRARLEALEISRAADNVYMILIASMKLAVTLRQRGQLGQVKEICEQQLQMANECGLSHTAVAGGFLAIWGEVLAELDDLAEASHRSKRGVELAESGEDMVVLGWSYLCLMRVLLTARDMAGAEELIGKVENRTRQSDLPPWIPKLMAAWQARLWLAQDKLEAASQWMAERGLGADGELQFLRDFEQIVLARVLIAQGRLDETATLLQHLLEAAEAGGQASSVIEILILQALALQAQGDTDQAISTLEKALTRAELEGFVRVFLDEGQPMVRLLYEAASRGTAPDYVRRLLAACPVAQLERTSPPEPQSPRAKLLEPLSEREIEVLQLIAEGLTNQEIASRLFISLNTVKGHTRNIYGKLDVHSRTQAVARARVLGTLSPS